MRKRNIFSRLLLVFGISVPKRESSWEVIEEEVFSYGSHRVVVVLRRRRDMESCWRLVSSVLCDGRVAWLPERQKLRGAAPRFAIVEKEPVIVLTRGGYLSRRIDDVLPVFDFVTPRKRTLSERAELFQKAGRSLAISEPSFVFPIELEGDEDSVLSEA